MRSTMLLQSGLLLALLAVASFARVLLCPRCGHEYEAGAGVCGHCGNALPSETPAPSVADPVPAASASPLWPEAVWREELTGVRQAMEREYFGIAWLRARNLRACAAIARPPAGIADEAAKIEEQAVRAVRAGRQPCASCQGRGHPQILVVTSEGKPGRQNAPGQRCAACDGTGEWPRRMTRDAFDAAYARATRAAEDGWAGAGWTQAGGAWLPPGEGTNLALRQMVALRHATGAACATCRGIGFWGCDDCGGAGRVACTDKGCVNGRVVCPDCDGTRKVRDTTQGRDLMRSCKACRQTGVVECPVCAGRGYLVCATCEGHGDARCRACDGRGERPLCRSCEGEGLRVCARCEGTGRRDGGECRACGGEGAKLCSSCDGSGRSRR